jgi:hypothetical protein
VYFTQCIIFETNCCPCFLVTFGKGNVCADEQPKDKKSDGGGMRTAVVGCRRGVKELTVNVIKKNED